MSERENFSPPTKRVIAQRANYRCVVPGCATPTTGPGDQPDNAALVGTASHIYSASANGPRGQAGLTPEEIRHADNAVWCCTYHGGLIDTNQGRAYPAKLLQGWKALQEAQIRRAMNHQPTPVGWIHGLRVSQSSLLEPGADFEFSKVTVLHGDALGKTAIAEWIATCAGRRFPDRWRQLKAPVLAEITYFAPEQHRAEFDLEGGAVRLSLDGRRVAEAPRDFAVVLVPEDFWRRLETACPLNALGSILDVEPDVVGRLIEDIRRNGTRWGRRLVFCEDQSSEEDHEATTPSEVSIQRGRPLSLQRGGVSLAGMATSERTRVVLEFATALARERASRSPTLLVLDASAWNFDDANWAATGDFLMSQPFQTLVTRWAGWVPKDMTQWAQATRFELAAGPDGAILKADPW